MDAKDRALCLRCVVSVLGFNPREDTEDTYDTETVR